MSLLVSAFVFQEDGTYQTRGIDMAVTQERVILLDTQVRFMCKCNAAEMPCLFFHFINRSAFNINLAGCDDSISPQLILHLCMYMLFVSLLLLFACLVCFVFNAAQLLYF